MTLQDKLAALPPMPKVLFSRCSRVWGSDIEALMARNALLCEALNRTIRKIEGYQRAGWIMGGGALEEARFTLIDAHATLAACEVKQP